MFAGDQLPHLRRYRAEEKDCAACMSKSMCTKGKARTLQYSIYENLIAEALERSKTQRAKELGRLRQIQAEGTFAHLKEVLKFKKLYSLGLESARKKFTMACAVINLKKLVGFLPCLYQLSCLLRRILQTFKEQRGLNPICLAF